MAALAVYAAGLTEFPPRPGTLTQDPLPPVVVDAEHAWIKTKADNVYREQSCNVPAPESPAGTLLRLMKAAAIGSRRQ